MKALKLFPVLALFIFLGSCGEKENRDVEVAEDNLLATQEVPDPDEVINDWSEAWNSNDPAQVQAMTAPDAVLVLNGNEFPQDSLAGWVQAATSAMKDLQMQSLKKGSADNFAFDTGTYSHTYTDDTTRYEGTYTFIWERSNEDNEWMVKVMNISNAQPMEE